MALQLQKGWQQIQHLGRRAEPMLRSRLTFASGTVLSAVLALRLVPFSGVLSSAQPEPFQESLWLSTGVVRQSIVDLYRIQRTQQKEAAAVDPEDGTPEANTKAQQASADTNAAGTDSKPTESTASSAEVAAAPEPAPPAPEAPPVDQQNVIDNALEMRVAIARNMSSLTVGTDTLGWVINTDGSAHCEIAPQSSLTATANDQGISFSGCQLGGAVWLEADPGGFIFINDSWYRGRMLLFNNGGELLAVNFVLLGQYLSSVVGSEMYHHWPLESLKAQAVAARSYALTHHVIPASDHFDLDNTQRFQAYKGIGMETTNTQIAVAETAGEFISYDGGIVESLYAASDQIVQEAHKGQGMSQHGAKDYAMQGYRYDEILGVYYPGTSLARLVIE